MCHCHHNQRNRRNLTDVEIYQCIKVVDRRKKKGENFSEYPRNEEGHIIKPSKNGTIFTGEPSMKKTAEIVGVGQTKVQQARTVIDHAEKYAAPAIFGCQNREALGKLKSESREEANQLAKMVNEGQLDAIYERLSKDEN